MNNLEENLKCLSPRQQNWSNKSRELYKEMGTHNVDDLKAMIWMNIIKKKNVTTDNVNLATKAYSLDFG